MKKDKWKRTRRLTPSELLAAFETGLNTLEHLGKIYDSGFSPIAFQLATEIHKILTENSTATQLRGQMDFESPDHGDESRMLNALHKLTMARISGDPPVLDFLPAFAEETGIPTRKLKFRDWWNRDIIYRASAAPVGTPAGMIPVNASPSVPFDERDKVTRRELISLVRNKAGAHQEKDYPVLLEEMDHSAGWGSFGASTPTGEFSTDDGSLVTQTTIIPAMVRQISIELLRAYGR